jgi:transcriptional regulator with GAF, ATPase, and Fis domain
MTNKAIKDGNSVFRKATWIAALFDHLTHEVKAFEKRWLEMALKETKGVKAEAARLLGLNKDKMKYGCRKYAI